MSWPRIIISSNISKLRAAYYQKKADFTILKGWVFQHPVSAKLLASGYYLETGLILKRGSEEILEFDAIATPVNDYLSRKIIEVKSGDWGVSDLFKLYGQINYTGNKYGWLIHKKPASDPKKKAISEFSKNAPVSAIHVHIDGSTDCQEIPKANTIPNNSRELIFIISWWSHSADRVAQSKFKDWIKSQNPNLKIHSNARTYCNLIDNSLLEDKPLVRAHSLYNAYKTFPQITSNLIKYVESNGTDDLKTVRKTVCDQFGRTHLQYIMALEHKVRIAIIKNAYDAILLKKQHITQSKSCNNINFDVLDSITLPASFKERV